MITPITEEQILDLDPTRLATSELIAILACLALGPRTAVDNRPGFELRWSEQRMRFGAEVDRRLPWPV